MTFRVRDMTRTRWDQLKAQLRTFLNNNPDVEVVAIRFVESDPP